MPLPRDAGVFHASAALGAKLAALLNPDTPVPGVSTGTPRPELAPIAVPSTRPRMARDWGLAGWGNRTEAGVTMPLRGHFQTRAFNAAEAALEPHTNTLGSHVLDIGISQASFWRGLPETVWECRVGGYQVLKKWLSYRDQSIIGRPLTANEVAHFQQTARRIAAILMLGPALDSAYQSCVSAHGSSPPTTERRVS